MRQRHIWRSYRMAWAIVMLCTGMPQLSAQNTPVGSHPMPYYGSQAPNPIPLPYPSTTVVNTVITWDVTRPQMSQSTVIDPASPVSDVKQTTQYIDGLGRPIQTVAKQQSPAGFDMVSPVIFDPYGRESVKYLPYVSPGSDGTFKMDPFNEQQNFSANQYPGEQYYYGQTNFEASPLDRPVEELPPGNSWVGNAVGTTVQYMNNTSADSVVIWNMDYTSGDLPVSGGLYSLGTLSVTITTDEQGDQVMAYKDLLGHTILKKVQSVPTPGTGHVGWLCTYYIYDDIGNLRCVIQPNGTTWLMQNGWNFDNTTWATSTIAQQQCFSYEYDGRNRMTIKRVPGAGEVWMAYDEIDRLVMTQDANLRGLGQWLYTSYDALDRPVATGLWTNSGNLATQQAAAATSTNYPNPTSNYEILTKTFYDDYTQVAATGSGLSTTLIPANTNPNNNQNTLFYTPSNTTFPYAQPITANYQMKNQVTGTQVEIPGTGTYLYTVNFYDDRNRLLQTQSTNYTGAKDTVTMEYSFSGQLLATWATIGKGGNNPQYSRYAVQKQYDAMGRVLQTNEKLWNSTLTTLSRNQYNELGQLSEKYIGLYRNTAHLGLYTTNPLDSISYTYNIRGWLNGINKGYADAPSGQQNWFGEDISYDHGFNADQLNGNIAGVMWATASDQAQRAYGYSYDNANRLLEADFTQYTNSNWSTAAGIDFTTSGLSYDNNGNILTMNQKGLTTLTSSTTIDSLVYGYNPNSNQLNYVTDLANNANSTLGDFKEVNNNTSQDYTYDGNGNLTQDNNKAISSIAYNYLNLPKTVTVTSKGTVSYVYDAAGNKLEKVTVDNTVSPAKTTKTDYIDAYVYQNDTLQYIGQEEGRIRPYSRLALHTDTMFYDYFEKDHLGDTRVVLTDQAETDAYPTCTMEVSNEASDTMYFENVNTTRYPISSIPGFPSYLVYSNPNQYVAQTNGSGNKIGPSITLRVMAGDEVNIHVNDWYNTYGVIPANNPPNNPITDIINALANSLPSAAVTTAQGTTLISQLTSNPSAVLSPGVTGFITAEDAASNSSAPMSYLNYILFDDQMNIVMTNDGNNSGFQQVGSSNTTYQSLNVALRKMTKSGYLYIYLSSETPNINVYFDNFIVSLVRGPLTETDNYYPFGLAMAGIDDQAAGNMDNRHKYNGIEYDSSLGIDEYESQFRNLDPQTGRWWQIDPKPNEMISPYAGMIDNPVRFTDPLGDTAQTKIGDNNYYIGRLQNGSLGYFGNDGKQYTGKLDAFSTELLGTMNQLANVKDDEVQIRLNEVLTGSKMITIDEGINNFDEKTGELTWSNTKNSIMLNNGGDIEKPGPLSKTQTDPDIDLAHELLGHGYQYEKGVLNHDRMEPFHNAQFQIVGFAEKVEADATNIANRVALSTGRPQMVQPVYIERLKGHDGDVPTFLYHLIPRGYNINNRSSQNPSNYTPY